jgi:hypothetical protein
MLFFNAFIVTKFCIGKSVSNPIFFCSAGNADEQLNPKKKTWEQIQPDLRINAEGVATYKGAPWLVEGKEGLFKAPTAVNSAIK